MICEYCNNKFKTISALNHHKKTTKYCLEIQNKENAINFNNEDDVKSDECNFCKKIFANKYNLEYHLRNCKQKAYEEEIKRKEEEEKQVIELKEKIAFLENTIICLENEKREMKEQIIKLETERIKSSFIKLGA